MSCNQSTPNVNKTFIIESQSSTGGTPVLSACTVMYTNLLESCSGDTSIQLGTGFVTFNSNVNGVSGFTASTIEASSIYSGSTDLLNIFSQTDTFVTGGTYNNETITLIRNDNVDILITGITTDNFFVTGQTFNNNNLQTILNNGDILNTDINNFTGLTVNGTISATTYDNLPLLWEDSTGLNSLVPVNQINNIASGTSAVAYGVNNNATGNYSHAEGANNTASGDTSHAEGFNNQANGDGSHAEGSENIANGLASHVEGFNNRTEGVNAHAEGANTVATGNRSHSQNLSTQALTSNTHAGGNGSTASGDTSFVHSTSSNAGGVNSAILGGNNNILTADAINSIILGCQNITGDLPNTVYGCNFNIGGDLVQQGLGTAVADVKHFDNSFSFYIDDSTLAGRYKDNLGVVRDLKVGYEEYDFALRSSGITTYYTDFFTCYNNAIDGDVIDVQTDYTTDCGLSGAWWFWDSNISINLNGHHLIVTNTYGIVLNNGVEVRISNGVFEAVNNLTSRGAFNFFGNNKVIGDGAINIISNDFSFSNYAGTENNYVSNVIMDGSPDGAIIGANGSGRIFVDNSVIHSYSTQALFGDNIEVSNSSIYGRLWTTSGRNGAIIVGSERTLINCKIFGTDGVYVIGPRAGEFYNCHIYSLNTQVTAGIGAETNFYNCTLERKGTVGTLYSRTNSSNSKFYDCIVISTGGCFFTNTNLELHNCTVIAKDGVGVDFRRKSGFMKIIGGSINSTGGDTIAIKSANATGYGADIFGVKLTSNTTGQYCLDVEADVDIKFANLTLENTATPTDIYNRASLPLENLQINTSDAQGNIIKN